MILMLVEWEVHSYAIISSSQVVGIGVVILIPSITPTFLGYHLATKGMEHLPHKATTLDLSTRSTHEPILGSKERKKDGQWFFDAINVQCRFTTPLSSCLRGHRCRDILKTNFHTRSHFRFTYEIAAKVETPYHDNGPGPDPYNITTKWLTMNMKLLGTSYGRF